MMNKKVWMLSGIWILCNGMIVLYLLSSLNIVSDISQFMPQSKKNSDVYVLQKELLDGPSATTLLLSITGNEPQHLAMLSRSLRGTIEGKKNVIQSIDNGEYFLERDTVEKLEPYKFLLLDLDWSVKGLESTLHNRLSDLRTGAGPALNNQITSDPYLSLNKYLLRVAAISGPEHYDGVWFDAEAGALLLVKVEGDALDLDVMETAITQLRQTFSELQGSARATINIAGPGVIAVETRDAIRTTIQYLSFILAGLLIMIFGLAYRSVFLALLAGVPLFSAILTGLVVTQAIFGEVHGIVVAFGVTLLGVCLDYPLHLFSHHQTGESLNVTLDRIWPTLRLGAVSSALAYFILIGSGFSGLSQLALFASSGLLAALLVTKYILPAWVNIKHIRPRYFSFNPEFSFYWRMVIIIVILAVPIWAWFSADVYWERGVDAISPVPIKARELDSELRNALGAPELSHVFIVKGETRQQALRKTENILMELDALEKDNLVERVIPATRILPSLKLQQERQNRIPPREELTRRLKSVTQSMNFQEEAFSSFLDSAEEARSQSLLDSEGLEPTFLYQPLKQGLVKTEHGWLSIIRLNGIKSETSLSEWLGKNPEAARHHVKIKDEVENMLESYRDTTLTRIVLAFFALSILVYLGIRSVRRTMRIMLPVGAGVIAALSAPLISGVGINVFHILAAMLVMGMGLDYSLFFNRDVVERDERVRSFHAISISMLTTVVTFSVMALSDVPVMAAMGVVIALGIIQCYLLAWMFSIKVSGR